MLSKQLIMIQVRIDFVCEVVKHIEEFFDAAFLFVLLAGHKKADETTFDFLSTLLCLLLLSEILRFVFLFVTSSASSSF